MECEEIQQIIEKPSEIVVESRIKRREDLNKSRGLHRTSAFDKNRFLESEILTESDIKGISGRIKRRKHCTEEDLEKLTNAFFQSEQNIVEFIKITGAINVLVKELIGTERQLLAAQCICNLSLGDEISCNKVALFSGCYLVILLKNLSNNMLIKIIVWTLENLITSGSKALEILMSQELLKGILYIINNISDVQIKCEAVQTLDIIIDKKCKQLRADEIQEITKCLSNYVVNRNDLYALQSFNRILTERNVTIEASVMEVVMENAVKVDCDEKIKEISLEILINFSKSNKQNISDFLNFLMIHKIKLSSVINEIVSTPKLFGLSKSYLKLAGIILESSEVQNYLNYDDFLNNLKIPKILTL